MKIALLTPGFSTDENDWCIPVLYNLVRELAREHEIHVFTIRHPPRAGTYPFHGATVHALGGADRARWARIPLLFRALTAILGEARRKPFDLIHAFWADEPGFLAVFAGGMLQIPRVVSLMGGELVGLREIGYGGQLSIVNSALTGYALRGANAVTAGSAYLAQRAKAQFPEISVQVFPLGVDTDLFHLPTGDTLPLFPPNQTHLLHTAALVPIKEQATLFRAFARALQTHPDTHLHLLGDGPLRPTLEQLAEELNISAHLTFHGTVPHHETPRFYQAADLCVLSSRFESQGMVVLEAAACGVTTVGTEVGILPEVVPPEQVVRVGDVETLARAITSALSNPAQTRKIGGGHVAQVGDRYDLAKYIQSLSGLYSGLVTPDKVSV
ncbi:MAG: glycosyltransferase [Anaerolineales bacterium]|nr:glycosyltransferase [Anaerolineales bacterium]